MGLKNIFTKKAASQQIQAGSDSESNSAVSTPQSRSREPSIANSSLYSLPVTRQNSNSSYASSTVIEATNLSRYAILPDGKHVHRLKNARRQEKLGKMIRDIMGTGQKVGNDAVSAVPNFVKQVEQGGEGRLTLMQGLVNRLAKGEENIVQPAGPPNASEPRKYGDKSSPVSCNKQDVNVSNVKSLAQKYGRCQEIIGRGSYGVVRVSHKTSASGKEQLFAVKEFKKKTTESPTSYQDRLMSEFCISSSLDHLNIIFTFDLMKDANGGCCQIMEYCSGGDLYSLVLSSGTGLTAIEADCFFKQILRGVVYMHSMGVAHCDLKPENILLTRDGVCKITDFGNAECFRMAWENDVHYSKGVIGSGPYIAPEEFKGKSFDPRAVDIWAMGIIYMVMRTGSYLWRKASADEDDNYARYLRDRKTSKGFSPVEKLSPSKSVYVIYSILDPVSSRRITGKQILNSEWGRSIKVCDSADFTKCSTPPSISDGVQSSNTTTASKPVAAGHA